MGTPYQKGLHDLGGGCWAWLQPDGSWGWSNAGLVSDGEAALLVDTLFDLPLTAEMLDAMRAAVPAAGSIDVLVNTHANGDHCYGNELVGDAVIVASQACADEMGDVPPAMLAGLVAAADSFGEAGDFIRHCFGPFAFDGITPTLPTETFEGRQVRRVGDLEVELVEVGPAHTRGDVLVHVPGRHTVYTGDILFIDGHPIMWEGPIGNWIRACDAIAAMDVETVVPGHGPVTDLAGVGQVRDYLAMLEAEARKRYDAGMPVKEAARDIALDDYAAWGDAERIVVNVSTLYREFGDPAPAPGPVELFTWMAELYRDRR